MSKEIEQAISNFEIKYMQFAPEDEAISKLREIVFTEDEPLEVGQTCTILPCHIDNDFVSFCEYEYLYR